MTITFATNVILLLMIQSQIINNPETHNLKDHTASKKPEVIRGPYLQSGTSSSIIIRWRTNLPTDSKVLYGLDPEHLEWSIETDSDTTEHIIKLSGLTASTKYFYSIGNLKNKLSGRIRDYYFITSPRAPYNEAVRIWVLGDFGTGDPFAKAVKKGYLKYRKKNHTDLWLMLGDIAYYNGSDEEFQQGLFDDIYDELFRNTVSWPTVGNHDGRSANSEYQSGPYYDIFSLPVRGEGGGIPSNTEAYYSFDYGDIHIISLDSEDSDRGIEGKMVQWLINDLNQNKSKWLIVFFHHPPYTKGSHDSDNERDSGGRMKEMRENILPILEKHGTDLVLSGHSHAYERSHRISSHYGSSENFNTSNIIQLYETESRRSTANYTKSNDHQGTIYVVCGVGCYKPRIGSLDHPAMAFSSNKHYGSMSIEIQGDKLYAAFINSKGKVKDSFCIVKE
ncbi:metallophosphoesterase [Bacteroidota bacterium]